MTYTVIWERTAENELAEIWVRVVDKNAVSQAANHIDAALRDHAHTCGDPHLGQDRIWLVPPLGIIFRIQEPDCLVRVLAV
jgi:plasmid stabilization system protein ParE